MARIYSEYINDHPSVYDEMHTARKLRVEYTLPDAGCNMQTGMLFLVPGYGGNIESKVYCHIREELADKHNLVIAQCEYFGIQFMQGELPPDVEKMGLDEHVESIELNWEISLAESKRDFNDMGMMQALDIVTSVLYLLETVEIVNTNRIILFEQSHGAYLAHLSNIICPHLFSFILDISGYIMPYYLDRTRVVGYQLGDSKIINVLYKYMVMRNREIRYNENLYSLDYLYQVSDNKCGIIAVQGNEDWMVDYKEKQYFIEKIPHGQMMLVTSEDVDGTIFKNTNHGCGLDYIKFLDMIIPILDERISVSNDLLIDDLVCIGDKIQISYNTNRPIIDFTWGNTELEI